MIARRVSCADDVQTKSFGVKFQHYFAEALSALPAAFLRGGVCRQSAPQGLVVQNTQQLISIQPPNMHVPAFRYEGSHTNWRRVSIYVDLRMFVKAVRLLLVRLKGAGLYP